MKGYRYRYIVRTMIPPDFSEIILGGNNDMQKAERIALDMMRHYYENPWDKPNRKIAAIENISIVDTASTKLDSEIVTNKMDKLSEELIEKIRSGSKKQTARSAEKQDDTLYAVHIKSEMTEMEWYIVGKDKELVEECEEAFIQSIRDEAADDDYRTFLGKHADEIRVLWSEMNEYDIVDGGKAIEFDGEKHPIKVIDNYISRF